MIDLFEEHLVQFAAKTVNKDCSAILNLDYTKLKMVSPRLSIFNRILFRVEHELRIDPDSFYKLIGYFFRFLSYH